MADKFALARASRDERLKFLERLKTAKDSLEAVKAYLENRVLPYEESLPTPMGDEGAGGSGPQIASAADAVQVAEVGLSA